VFLFVLYGVAAWILAAKWRRQLRGFLSVALSLALLFTAAWLYTQLSHWTNGRVALPLMQVLLYPYIALIAAGGIFLVLLPRTGVRRPGHCARCEYDLVALEPTASLGVICPECGLAHQPGTLVSLDDIRARDELHLIRARSATRPQAPAPPGEGPRSTPSAAA
jgi:hypothetical protein